ncbi:MAG: DUF4335 domain-containing protein [Cyanobacteria bacterium]|nr:DUF4335 domain-containing protein [Cyanobacteriota bacterium]
MKQTLVYSQQSCRLNLEGFPDVSAGHSPDTLGIITSWTLDWPGRPQLEGRLDHLVGLINVILPYARYLMSGVSRPFGSPAQPVAIAPAGPGKHLLVLRSGQPGVGSLEVHLDDAELADLVRVLDSLRLDSRLHLQPPLPHPLAQPLRRRELRQAEPLAQRLAAPVGGLAALALTAGLSSLAPLPVPAPQRTAGTAATTAPGPPGLRPDRSAVPTTPDALDPTRPIPQTNAGPSQPPTVDIPPVAPTATSPTAPPTAPIPAAPAPRTVFSHTPPSNPAARP